MLKITGIICLIYSGLWLFNFSIYFKYLNGMDDYTFPTNYSTYDEENYAYTVAIPFILSFTGNLGVVDMDDGDTMIIWPSRYRDTRYGFMITTKEGEPYSIELDENLETEHAFDREVLEENRERIEELYNVARKRWGIFESFHT